jgi:dTDP-4-dehydrorhamnose reductase
MVHATASGSCSWYEFASEIFRQVKSTVKVVPIVSEEYPTEARRPKNSRLSKNNLDKCGFNQLSKWEDSLRRYLDEIYSNDKKI